jgi:hypothetical protein
LVIKKKESTNGTLANQVSQPGPHALTTWPSGQSQLKSRISQQLSQNPTFFFVFLFFLQFDVWALLPHHHLLQVPAMTPRTTASVSGVSCQIDSERFKSPIDAPFVAT